VSEGRKIMGARAETSGPPAPVTGRGRGWYRGDCHVHSLRSHGADQTPKQLAAEARALGLDFISVTEHNTAASHATWAAVAETGLLVILGQEVTTRTGHWVALGLAPEQGVAHQQPWSDNGSGVIEWHFSSACTGFVRVQVRYGDGSMAAITNPVLVSL
jgi:hypothetical protein